MVVKQLCTKTTLETVLDLFVKQVKEIFGDKLKEVILFGSYARGDFDNESDIDVFVLVDMLDNELSDYIYIVADKTYDINLEYNVLISFILKDINHFNDWKEALPFYNNIEKEGVRVNA